MPQDNPPLLDKTMNTTESTPRNLADVLASGLANIANNVKPDGSDISIDVPGMSANNVDDGFSELKQSLDGLIEYVEISGTTTSSGALILPAAIQNGGIIIEAFYKNISGFIFRRDSGYLTCCDNNRNTLANTDVVIRCWYISASHLHYNN